MKNQKELATVLNNAVEICSEILEIGEKTSSVAKKALLVIGDLRTLLAVSEDTVEEKAEAPTPAPQPEKVKKAEAPTKASISKEDVRKVLAEVANNGHRDEVKALLAKYGADNLTTLDDAHYADIMKDAEVLKDA